MNYFCPLKEMNKSMAKITSLFQVLLISVVAVSCHQNPKSEESDAAGTTAVDTMMVKTEKAKPKFTAAMVDNKKDPNCGMPVTAGIADTLHYKGKVYGFCSDECRDAFLKNPDALVKNAELKN